MNPRSGRARRAIEVYPHPATVALFRLGRTLKYKNKPRPRPRGPPRRAAGADGPARGPGRRRRRRCVVASPAWSALRDAVVDATRKSELRVVEDQVDAVVAPYVALFAERAPERTTTYGDFETGYIVTPTLPDGLAADAPRAAAPRCERRPRTSSAPRSREYAATHDAVRAAADGWVALVTAILDDAGINYLSVTGRAKSVASFAAKAGRDGRRRARLPRPAQPDHRPDRASA